MPFKVKAFGITDIGLVRGENQDVYALKENFFVVADGMGGHRSGDVAAHEAVKRLLHLFGEQTVSEGLKESADQMAQVLEEVNRSLFQMSRRDVNLRGMGTTLSCLLFHDEGVVIGHIGDSRIYRYRDHLEQLTHDHTLFQQMYDQGRFEEIEKAEGPIRSILTRAVGTEPVVKPSTLTCIPFPGDRFLLCSDGLSDYVSTEEIATCLKEIPSCEACAQALVDRAKEVGGFDNITVIVLNVVDLS